MDGIQTLLSVYNVKVLLSWENNNCYNNNSLTLKFLSNGGTLIVLGDLSSGQMLGVHFSFNLFLNESGVLLKESIPCIFIFKPGSSFEYLGYNFIFSNSRGNLTVNQGINDNSLYSKSSFFNKYTQILVMLSSFFYSSLVNKLKVCLHQNNYYLDVDRMIVNLNVLMFSVLKNLGYFNLIQLQLNRINYLCRFWFWNYLKKKYQSNSKLVTFLNSNFISLSNSFLCNNVVLLNFCEVFKNVMLFRLWNLELLDSNISLNTDFFLNESLQSKEVFLSIFFLVNYKMSKDLINLILWNNQNYNCVYCTGNLFSVDSFSVIYYVPVVFSLNQLFFLYFLDLNEIGKVWFLNDDFKNVDIVIKLFNENNQNFWNMFFDTKVYFYLIHNSCRVLTIKSLINEAGFFLWNLNSFCSSSVYYFYQVCSVYVTFMCNNVQSFPNRMYMWGGEVV